MKRIEAKKLVKLLFNIIKSNKGNLISLSATVRDQLPRIEFVRFVVRGEYEIGLYNNILYIKYKTNFCCYTYEFSIKTLEQIQWNLPQ